MNNYGEGVRQSDSNRPVMEGNGSIVQGKKRILSPILSPMNYLLWNPQIPPNWLTRLKFGAILISARETSNCPREVKIILEKQHKQNFKIKGEI